MAAQMAKHIFNVPRVICRIYDPLRQEIFQTLGLETLSPTTVFAEILKKRVEG
jgi:trk system potassium uptake protein TrkA